MDQKPFFWKVWSKLSGIKIWRWLLLRSLSKMKLIILEIENHNFDQWFCTCGSLSISQGSVSYNKSPVINDKYPLHTKASFSGNHEYKISGDRTRRCQTSGSWSLKNAQRCNQINENRIYCFKNPHQISSLGWLRPKTGWSRPEVSVENLA